MTDAVQVALIMSAPVTLLGLIHVVIEIAHGRKLRDIHVQINSRMSQLLAAVEVGARSVGHTEGVAEGAQAERDRVDKAKSDAL